MRCDPGSRVWIGVNVVQPSKQAKFLGVTITQSLTWMPHVRSLITKARRATSMIKILKGETWVTPRSLEHVTGALVQSRLTYGHEAFISATDSLWLDLERAELAVLKAALGLPRYSINDLVYQEVGWLPLREESRFRCAHFEACACTVPYTVSKVLGTDFAPARCIQRDRLARKCSSLSATAVPLHLTQFAVLFIQIVTTVCWVCMTHAMHGMQCMVHDSWALGWFDPLFFEPVGTSPHPAIWLRKIVWLSSWSEPWVDATCSLEIEHYGFAENQSLANEQCPAEHVLLNALVKCTMQLALHHKNSMFIKVCRVVWA